MSYKLYYVNYRIRLENGPVDILCESRSPHHGRETPPSSQNFPLLLRVTVLEFVLNQCLELVRIRSH